MKNIMAIDGAQNCVYDIFEITDEQFRILFPAPGQDIAFAEDFDQQISAEDEEKMSGMWEKRIPKKDAVGIHGTIFYELEHKREYYPTLRDEEACNPGLGGQARADGITYEELVEQGKAPEVPVPVHKSTDDYNYAEILADYPALHLKPRASVIMEGDSVIVETDGVRGNRYRFTFPPYYGAKVTSANCRDSWLVPLEDPTVIFEIKNSRWIDQLIGYPDDRPDGFMDRARHFVLPLGDRFVEVVADEIRCHSI